MLKPEEQQTHSRRDLLSRAGAWTAVVAVGGLLAGMLRSLWPRATPEPSGLVRIGRPEEYPPGTVRALHEHKIVVRATESGLAAMSLICPHLGCVVVETPEGFNCPCHGSTFDRDGKALGGPASRALKWLLVASAADGSLRVDTRREVAPGTFHRIASS